MAIKKVYNLGYRPYQRFRIYQETDHAGTSYGLVGVIDDDEYWIIETYGKNELKEWADKVLMEPTSELIEEWPCQPKVD